MAQINKPDSYFRLRKYDGNGGSQSITFTETDTNMQPDISFFKSITTGHEWGVYDSSRGNRKANSTSENNAENTDSTGLASWDTNGFTFDGAGFYDINFSSNTLQSCHWKVNGGTTAANTDGSISSTVQANTTNGISIVQYTGTGSNGTVGHGLGVTPSMIWIKDRDAAVDWAVYHIGTGGTAFTEINTTVNAQTNSTAFNDTSPTTSVFSIGTGGIVNTSSNNYIAYCFAPKPGFSAFGTFTANGSGDGPFVYTGFKPALYCSKNITTNASTHNWNNFFNKGTFAPNMANNAAYRPYNDGAITWSGNNIDFLSNGVKHRIGNDYHNYSTNTYIWWAFAAEPLVGTNYGGATAG